MCIYSYSLSLADCEAVGLVRAITVDPHVRQLLFQQFHADVETASAFDRMTISGRTFYSRSYNRTKKKEAIQ